MKSRFFLVALLAVLLCSTAFARTWTDTQGQTTQGTFVRVFGTNVVILSGGKALTVPFTGLSKEDQQYVREQLEAKGETGLLAQLDALTSQSSGYGGSAPGYPAGPGMTGGSSSTPYTPPASGSGSPPGMSGGMMGSGPTGSTGYPPGISGGSSTPGYTPYTPPTSTGPRYTPPVMPTIPTYTPPPLPTPPSIEFEIVCTNCGHKFPDDTPIGTPCPFCNPSTTSTYNSYTPPVNSSSTSDRRDDARGTAVGMSLFVVSLVCVGTVFVLAIGLVGVIVWVVSLSKPAKVHY